MGGEKVILAAATGYAVSQILAFVDSLDQTGFDGELVLIIYRKQLDQYQRRLKHIQNYAINFQFSSMGKLHYRNDYVGLLKHKFARRCATLFFKILAIIPVQNMKEIALNYSGYPHVGRFFEYRKALKLRPNAKKILLTDIRDVIFQAPPLDGVIKGLHVGMENEEVKLKDETYNADWILDAYGMEVLEQMGMQQISCSGVSYGDRDAILIYIELMINEFCNIPYKIMSNRIYDQAMHNKLIFDGRIPNIQLCQPNNSRIITLGLFSQNEIFLVDGKIVNKDQTVIPIVHQYDRHKFLLKIINENSAQDC